MITLSQEIEILEKRLAASEREADRLRHHEEIEGDYVCPDSLRADAAEARVARLEATNGTLAVRIGELEDALRPFATIGALFVGDPLSTAPGVWLWKRQSNVAAEPGITIADVLAARAALAPPPGDEKKGGEK